MRLKSLSLVIAASLLVIGGAVSAHAMPIHRTAEARQIVPSWVSSATVYEVNVRQFSPEGNFAGVTAALPRIKALGTNVIWLMPIYPVGKLNARGSLGSPYSVANYTSVNPDFGTDADFNNLVDTAHSMGMKVVLDWVANHSAWDNPWITQHPDWYTQDANGKIISPAGTDWTDVADLNYNNLGLRAAMTDAMKYWVTKFDIDGYRCDAAGMVPTDFWNDATAQVDKVKQLWWLAEDQSTTDLLYSAFSSNYNWTLLDALNHVGGKDLISQAIVGSQANYPSNTFPMNFITNHDENSWNGTEFQRMGNAVKESAAITFVTPGIPLIYNGQEIGLNHQLQFFEKDPISWGATPAASPWTSFYSKLTKLRANNPALWSGSAGGTLNFITNSNSSLLQIWRGKGSNRVIFLSNLSAKNIATKLAVSPSLAGRYFAYSTNKAVTLTKGQKVSVTIPAWSFVIYSSAAAK
jgi:glycosidase